VSLEHRARNNPKKITKLLRDLELGDKTEEDETGRRSDLVKANSQRRKDARDKQ
jgi:hypothetical protein